MSTAYEVKKDGDEIQIIRLKDDKIMANVVDGAVQTTAPAYNRASILDELTATWLLYTSNEEEEANEDEIEMEIPQTVAGIDAEELIPVVESDEVAPEEDDELTSNIKSILEVEGVEGVSRYVSRLLGEKEANEAPIDYSNAPKCDPRYGDRTPEFMAWLKDNHPSEALKRYGSL